MKEVLNRRVTGLESGMKISGELQPLFPADVRRDVEGALQRRLARAVKAGEAAWERVTLRLEDEVFVVMYERELRRCFRLRIALAALWEGRDA